MMNEMKLEKMIANVKCLADCIEWDYKQKGRIKSINEDIELIEFWLKEIKEKVNKEIK